ncbi:phage major capsid protein [Sporanaerobium hydrogeniformans]|uniref:Phage major capsid protein n=1 Tax=Sporanaerobium hydrogeniformans TaxID=3072179 RepID=A0AC61D8R0_9FIRM|nr:phage major capsid protein [Sporanaerobium hydrogeniformans]PHV69774.1 phage major capsid protein [Sporanaerobium hydrogeniformans]
MQFKNKEDYQNQRTQLLANVKELIDAEKHGDAEVKMNEVETLDSKWAEDAKELANKAALEDRFKALSLENKSQARTGVTVGTLDNTFESDIYNSKEYRVAFMNYVTKGVSIPSQFQNADANTKTTDVGAMIPSTVLEKIVEKMEATGMILPLVTRTSIKGGVTVPISNVKPVATWVAEGSGSDKQKKTTGTITFAYHKLRCAVSVSLETDTMALQIFETTLISNVAEAMVKAIEQSILTGTGIGQPKGILKETVVAGQNIDIAKAGSIEYATLVAAEAALPLAYEADAVWLMTKKTFMQFIGMVDAQKQPIARVNYGISGKPERILLGRTVICNDYMESYVAAPAADSVVAALFNMKDYALNTNLDMTIKRYEDNDTDDQVTKAIMLVDGKVLDVNSLVTVTKKSA